MNYDVVDIKPFPFRAIISSATKSSRTLRPIKRLVFLSTVTFLLLDLIILRLIVLCCYVPLAVLDYITRWLVAGCVYTHLKLIVLFSTMVGTSAATDLLTECESEIVVVERDE